MPRQRERRIERSESAARLDNTLWVVNASNYASEIALERRNRDVLTATVGGPHPMCERFLQALGRFLVAAAGIGIILLRVPVRQKRLDDGPQSIRQDHVHAAVMGGVPGEAEA